jgi:nicotinamidase-related amidase
MKKYLQGLVIAVTVALFGLTQASAQEHKKALILIEYQNDWLAPTGGINTQFKDRGQFDTALKNSEAVLAQARKQNMEVIYVTMTLEPSFKVLGQASYGLRALMPQYHSFLGKQAEIYAPFKPLPNEYVVLQRTGSSAFGGSSLDSYLRNNKIDEIYLMGFALHLCVESTMRQAHDLGYTTHVIYDASSAFTKEQQTYFVQNIAPFYADPTTTQQFLASAK